VSFFLAHACSRLWLLALSVSRLIFINAQCCASTMYAAAFLCVHLSSHILKTIQDMHAVAVEHK